MTQTSTNTSTLTENKPVKLYSKTTMPHAKKLAKELTQFLETNNLVYDIAGKKYTAVEGWQFLGMQMGLTQVIISCERTIPDLDNNDDFQIRYKAEVEIINQYGTVVSRGFAWCSNKEKKKSSFEEYAIASMAQTRAIGKGYRNILSWIVKLAGYEATPLEEIDRDQMEVDLSKKKQEVLKAINAAGIVSGTDVMGYIEKTIGKRVIENIDDANKIIDSFKQEERLIA